MRYVSTRDSSLKVRAAEAVVMGLSRDGGLYLPERIPSLTASDLQALVQMDYPHRAAWVMKQYLDEFSHAELLDYAAKAYGPAKFDTPAVAPVRSVGDVQVLELWHGPTCAFKDMALQMLPYLLTASMQKTGEDRTVCILVATSGDTGKAALEGFRDVPQSKILVFYPEKGVSDIQKLQMVTQEGENVAVCAVRGNFDDAQSGVKAIFSDENMRAKLAQRGQFLSSANSINWGRVPAAAGILYQRLLRPALWRHPKAGRADECLCPYGQLWKHSCCLLHQVHGPAGAEADLRLQRQQCPDGFSAHGHL